MTQVTLILPEELACQARAAGLLSEETIEALLREAMRKQRVERLFATMEQLSALTPPLTEAEIAAEIEAARAARRKLNADHRGACG